MMFIIASDDPYEAVDYLISHTNKRFYFKQLIELGQLICSAGFSDAYKKVNRGKEIQAWIRKHAWWTYKYYKELLCECYTIFKTPEAYTRACKIKTDLLLAIDETMMTQPTTVIFRYKKEHKSEYATNSELPIKDACRAYIKYIEEFKFKKEDK